MLADIQQFSKIEDILRGNGSLAIFEKENGPIAASMMISIVELPDGIEVTPCGNGHGYAFEATFDAVDYAIGIVLYPESRNCGTGLWVTPQTKDAGEPPREAIEFFISVLLDSITPDGSFGVPIYTFFNENGNVTVVPASLEEMCN